MSPLISACIDHEAYRANLERRQVLGRARTREVVNARHRAILRAYLSGESVADIARAFRRDHTTICHAIKKRGRSG